MVATSTPVAPEGAVGTNGRPQEGARREKATRNASAAAPAASASALSRRKGAAALRSPARCPCKSGPGKPGSGPQDPRPGGHHGWPSDDERKKSPVAAFLAGPRT